MDINILVKKEESDNCVQNARTAQKIPGDIFSPVQEQPQEDGVPWADALRHTGLAQHADERDCAFAPGGHSRQEDAGTA